jgi:hypothetical protein
MCPNNANFYQFKDEHMPAENQLVAISTSLGDEKLLLRQARIN